MEEKELVELKDGTTLPLRNVPVSAWRYLGYKILFSIPVIGVICLIAVALFAQNVNVRSFALSYFCGAFIAIAIIVILYLISAPLVLELLDYILTIIEDLAY